MKIVRFLAVALFLVACGASEGDAKASLEADGYTDIKITGKTGDAFQFSAKDNKGAACTGTITITKSMGSTSTQKTAACSTP